MDQQFCSKSTDLYTESCIIFSQNSTLCRVSPANVLTMKTTTPHLLSSAILGETITYVAVVMTYAVFEFSSELFWLETSEIPQFY